MVSLATGMRRKVSKRDKERLAEEFLFVPHFVGHRWGTQINELLSGVFRSPFPFKEEDRWWKARADYFAHMGRIQYWMHKHGDEIRGVFYTNLRMDFVRDFAGTRGERETWGICHSTTCRPEYEDGSVGRQLESVEEAQRFQAYEMGVYGSSDGVFTSTNLVADTIGLPNVKVVGLPIFDPKGEPKTCGDTLLWSHRLAHEKRPNMLLDLPKHLQRRTVVTSPRPLGRWYRLQQGDFRAFMWGLSDAEYSKVRGEAPYFLSFAYHDNFGYAVLENVWGGAFAICPNDRGTAYPEILPSEMLYDDPEEIPGIVAYYDANPDERAQVVRAAQERLDRYRPQPWLERVLEAMGIDS